MKAPEVVGTTKICPILATAILLTGPKIVNDVNGINNNDLEVNTCHESALLRQSAFAY
jgi:hypothetical protein